MARAQEVDQEPEMYEPPEDLLSMASRVTREADQTERIASKREVMDKLGRIARDYQRSTPGEFVVFGRGKLQFTLSDLRILFDL